MCRFSERNYSLQINIPFRDKKVYISKEKENLSDDYKKLFSPCFFLPDIDDNDAILTTKYRADRYACNECHRLSQFIITNGVELNSHVPGVFRELLRILAEDEGNQLIDNVNSLLEYLRKYPGGLFAIPEKLFLSERDLCE